MDSVLKEFNESKFKRVVDPYDAEDQEGYVDSDEDMPRAEVQLADDAQWKIFQKNTFTRWTNEYLKKTNRSIIDLQTDFSDGLNLIALVESLSGFKFKHINRKPHFRTQKLENVTMVLKYLEDVEGLKLVNIDSTDIVDCRLKLILGLIWTLILHYSIVLPTWEGEEELPSDDKGRGPTPKQRLLGWINQKMPDLPIRNFTHDWNSGVAIGALVDACAPGLCPDWPDWDHRNSKRNASEAMDAAENWLDVAKFITPEELINPDLDEKAVMTYLSQFPNAKIKPGAPLRPRANPARVKAYGPGLEFHGNAVNAPARFIVETYSAGRGDLEILVLNPQGSPVPCEVVANQDKNLTYSCKYVPKMAGEHRVIIKFAGKELPNSPWKVQVADMAGDAKLVTCNGPGIDPDAKNSVGKRTWFSVFTEKAGHGLVDCQIRDPNGRVDTIKPRISRQDDRGTFLVEYTPKEMGRHEVEVHFAGQRIPQGPFLVNVSAQPYTGPAYCTGRGIQSRGLRVEETVTFLVHTEKAGEAKLSVNLVTGAGEVVPVTITRVAEHLYEGTYTPRVPGIHTLNVFYGGNPVQQNPFKVQVGPKKHSHVRVFGPGLEQGIVRQLCTFTVVCNEETGVLGVAIEGPSEAQIKECAENSDGSVQITYYVTAPGSYAINISSDDDPIPGSPFIANILPDDVGVQAHKATAYGPGIDPASGKVMAGEPTEFFIDLNDALANMGPNPSYDLVKVECHDRRGEPVDVIKEAVGPNKLRCVYRPLSSGIHTIDASILGTEIKNLPVRMPVMGVVQMDKVQLTGPGLEKALPHQNNTFTVDLRKACCDQNSLVDAERNLSVMISDEKGNIIPCQVERESPGLFSVHYSPDKCLLALVSCAMCDTPLPIGKAPIQVPVGADFDPALIGNTRIDPKAERLHKRSEPVLLAPNQNKVSWKSAAPNRGQARAIPVPPAQMPAPPPPPPPPQPVRTVTQQQGLEPMQPVRTVTQEQGLKPVQPVRTVSQEQGLKPVQPVRTVTQQQGLKPVITPIEREKAIERSNWPQIQEPNHPGSQIMAYGPGLEKTEVNRKSSFVIDFGDGEPSGVSVNLEGPEKTKLEFATRPDNKAVDVTYETCVAGRYCINVLHESGCHIPNSPFFVQAYPEGKIDLDVSSVLAYGEGLATAGGTSPLLAYRMSNFPLHALLL
ncbi:hypothetical protein Ciccas_007524 [Cichlidogyrus casuarinus]|uniref:Calponin-homology (CH) domain-containing protein n=1 Tax=Cichlidogyrus casuarinus TaxID=1844966 RepID=A0ABD2Q3E1_9PLAT